MLDVVHKVLLMVGLDLVFYKTCRYLPNQFSFSSESLILEYAIINVHIKKTVPAKTPPGAGGGLNLVDVSANFF